MTPEQQLLLDERNRELAAKLQALTPKTWETPAHREIDPFDVEYDEVIKASENRSENARKVRQFERENQELKDAVPDDIEFGLREIPTDVSDEEKLQLLKANNLTLVDVINNPNEQPKKPKFGSGLAVSISFKIKDEIRDAWVDENQVDVDTGEHYNFTGDLKRQHLKLLDERRKELAHEAIAEYDRQPESHSHYDMTNGRVRTGV
jgi:hypothetical protein